MAIFFLAGGPAWELSRPLAVVFFVGAGAAFVLRVWIPIRRRRTDAY